MFDSFFTDIVSRPDDDGPRLVLADWLEDQGDPRGEFIRIQCELAQLDWDVPRFDELSLQESDLLRRHRAKWVKLADKTTGVAYGGYDPFGVLLGESRRVYFHRGLLEYAVFKDFKRFEHHCEDLVRDNLIRRIAFNDLPATRIEPFLQSKVASCLRSVDFAQFRIGEHLDTFKESEFAANVESLAFSECHLGDYGIEKLLTPDNDRQEKALANVKELDLSFNSLRTPAQIKAVLAWPGIKQLRRLSLGLNSLENSIELLGRAKQLTGLFSLNLWGNDLTKGASDGFGRFCSASHFKRLVQLDLGHCYLKEGSLELLAKMKLPALRFLDVGTNKLGAEAPAVLSSARWCPGLRRLDLGDNELGDAGIAHIAADPNFSGLTHLCVRQNNVTAKGIESLIKSETLNEIRFLNIGRPEIEKDILKRLKKRYPKAVVEKPYGL